GQANAARAVSSVAVCSVRFMIVSSAKYFLSALRLWNGQYRFERDGDLGVRLQHAQQRLRRRDAVVGHQQCHRAVDRERRVVPFGPQIERDFALDARDLEYAGRAQRSGLAAIESDQAERDVWKFGDLQRLVHVLVDPLARRRQGTGGNGDLEGFDGARLDDLVPEIWSFHALGQFHLHHTNVRRRRGVVVDVG